MAQDGGQCSVSGACPVVADEVIDLSNKIANPPVTSTVNARLANRNESPEMERRIDSGSK